MMSTMLEDILGPQGAVARRLEGRYEYRPQQVEMAAAVERALTGKEHLLVEAGTGVGKSFAYLLPAIDFAVKHKKRVVISTHTISLDSIPGIEATESSSSKKITHGATCRAFLKVSLIAFSDSPSHFENISGPLTLIKFALDSLETAWAIRVFPVPGGP
jgi:hypothetical protein